MGDLHALDRLRGHSLVLPAEQLAAVPALYVTDTEPFEQKLIHLRFFVGSHAEWFIAELDPAAWLMFGHCDLGLGSPEWGYVGMHELAELHVRGSNGLPLLVERDLGWTPRPFGSYWSEG